KRNVFTLRSGRIAAPVPMFVVRERDLLGELQQRVVAARKDLRADVDVRLHDAVLISGEPIQLQENSIRYADFAEVVQRRRPQQEIGNRFRQPKLPRETGGPRTDALRMLSRRIVAELGGQRQPLEDLDLRLFQLPR